MKSLRIVLAAAIAGGSLAAPADMAAESYKLDMSRGKFPADVTVGNLNGVLPRKDAYKRGWTENGWLVERLDNRGYVPLSPTFHPGEDSENVLSLPALEVSPGMRFAWEARSVYKYFLESYRVEALPAGGGDAVVIAEVGEEAPMWTRHVADLTALVGQEVSLRFVCTSREGYMLALDKVEAGDDIEDPAGDESGPGNDGGEFVRNLLIDHATGMWCTSCMDAESYLDAIEERFGNRAIFLNTHVNDALGNDGYWQQFGWYNIPEMMLNRIRATAGSNSNRFEDYYDAPTCFAISVGADEPVGRTLTAGVKVKVSQDFDNSADKYRVGYVVTGNFHEPDNPNFVQSNNCTRPNDGAFYFLPTRVPPLLMFYYDTTLTYETAFTGVEGSLPAVLKPGEEYVYEWSVEVPELLADAAEARVVAFVLDAETGEVLNCGEVLAGHSLANGIRLIEPETVKPGMAYANGSLMLSLPAGETYRVEAYSLAGAKVSGAVGVSDGSASIGFALPAGAYIIRAAWAGGTAACKAFVK